MIDLRNTTTINGNAPLPLQPRAGNGVRTQLTQLNSHSTGTSIPFDTKVAPNKQLSLSNASIELECLPTLSLSSATTSYEDDPFDAGGEELLLPLPLSLSEDSSDRDVHGSSSFGETIELSASYISTASKSQSRGEDQQIQMATDRKIQEEADSKETRKSHSKKSILKKLKSPIKAVRSSRNKKKSLRQVDSREDTDTSIFEEHRPVDLLDDEREGQRVPVTYMSMNTSNSFGEYHPPNTIPTGTSMPAFPSPPTPQSPAIAISFLTASKTVAKPGISKPTHIKSQGRGKSIDKLMQFLTPTKKDKENEEKADMSIGLRLALPDKLDIMTGSTPIKDTPRNATPKKLIIVPEEQNNVLKSLRFTTLGKSPFKKKQGGNTTTKSTNSGSNDQVAPQTILNIRNMSMPKPQSAKDQRDEKEYKLDAIVAGDVDKSKNENVSSMRSSELEPSLHQITIPEATDLLIHARVCSLAEGYDRLLETRAKAGKGWFSFGNLVGLSRTELENMYLCAIGKKPEIPLFVGEAANNPPPLPNQGNNPFTVPPLGNPFENRVNDGQSLNSFPSSINSSDSSVVPRNGDAFPRLRKRQPKTAKPHPSTIKSLLECTDDLVVEGYFTETIGSESDLIAGADSTSVQAMVFSSHRQRQFIICYRGSMAQHTKPIKGKMHYDLDSNGLNSSFGDSYFQSELEPKVFNLIERLSSDNPFCDCIFTGHSYGGGLSMISAVQCAEKFPMMTVSAHVFGVPKVGGKKFREKANGLPNLKVIRCCLGQDTYVDLPTGTWEHIGHTISIKQISSKGKRRGILNANVVSDDTLTAHAVAYKFGKKSQNSNAILRVRNTILSDSRAKSQGKVDHEMRNYLHAVEQFTHMGCSWVTSFADEAGSGIVTAENEVRLVV